MLIVANAQLIQLTAWKKVDDFKINGGDDDGNDDGYDCIVYSPYQDNYILANNMPAI